MTNSLVDDAVVRRWDRTFAGGSDKRFPTTDLVRLEHWFFEHKPGRLLEYAFGTGVNLIYLLECGHRVDGIDASIEAKRLVERKLAARPDIRDRATLDHLSPESKGLPYPEDVFDYVVCISVLSLLGNRERVERLLGEFARVMKDGAKIILDVNSPRSEYGIDGTRLEEDVYEYRGSSKQEDPIRCYCPATEEGFVELVKPHFAIEDVGYSAHKYFHRETHEYIVCGRKP